MHIHIYINYVILFSFPLTVELLSMFGGYFNEMKINFH